MSTQPPKLLDQVRGVLRREHYAIRTENAYVNWIKRFILFHHKRHPSEMGKPEIEAFLTDLAQDQNVAASTQNQAFSAIIFLYNRVLGQKVEGINAVRASKPARLPVVMTKEETATLIVAIPDIHQLVGKLLYGSGVRLIECLRLRVKDIDFDQHQTCAELVEVLSSTTVKVINTGGQCYPKAYTTPCKSICNTSNLFIIKI